MSIFDGLIQIGDNGQFIYNDWIEWEHLFVPNKPEWFRELLRKFMMLFGHCLSCTALDGCYFVSRNMPKQPQHENCDCSKKQIDYITVKNNAEAECNIAKFTEYIFGSNEKSNGKNQIFNNLGFDVNDATYLQNEYNQQAIKQYTQGNYVLKSLDMHGQRLAIPITLNATTFYSGWLLLPEGKIRNTTPFGGWL